MIGRKIALLCCMREGPRKKEILLRKQIKARRQSPTVISQNQDLEEYTLFVLEAAAARFNGTSKSSLRA